MKPTLLVLAAGMGSRYGGIKQIEPVGPSQEIILEYSIYDALRAGFDRVVCVIRRDIEKDFVEHVVSRFSKNIKVDWVFQDLSDIPGGFSVPADRKKPWGTAHAIRSAKAAITGPFCVINADDFYGADAFVTAGRFLADLPLDSQKMCMVGYRLDNTVSEHGSVARGLCQVDSNNLLTEVVEHTKIEKTPQGILTYLSDGSTRSLTGSETVSMNLFGFSPRIFEAIETQFAEFLQNQISNPTAEFYIPTVVNTLIHQEADASLEVLQTTAQWFGITYRDDRPRVVQSIQDLVANGLYPANLWSTQ
ncbi:MAG: nucleotidyltransferase [Spirochaetales bacterium]|nr:nucleotidyltransferase [Spirochaetales bacterium]